MMGNRTHIAADDRPCKVTESVCRHVNTETWCECSYLNDPCEQCKREATWDRCDYCGDPVDPEDPWYEGEIYCCSEDCFDREAKWWKLKKEIEP